MTETFHILPVFNLDAGAGGGGGGGAGGQAAGGAGGGSQAAGAAAAGAATSAAATGGGGLKNPFTGEAAGGGASQQGGDQAGQQATGAYYPDKLPEHLRGPNDRETIDRLNAAYSGAREELSKRGAAPKDAKEYVFDIGDDLKKVYGDPETNEELKVFRQVAHKHGLTKEQAAGIVRDYYAGRLDAGLDNVLDPIKEAKALIGDEAIGRGPQEIAKRAGEIWKDTTAWVDSLVRSKRITADQADAGKAMLESAAGIQFVRALKEMTGQSAIVPGGGGGAAGGITKDTLNQRIADPRNNPFDAKYDATFRTETDRLYQAFYAGGS